MLLIIFPNIIILQLYNLNFFLYKTFMKYKRKIYLLKTIKLLYYIKTILKYIQIYLNVNTLKECITKINELTRSSI